MSAEKELQTKIIRYLKSKKCYVIKTKPGVGVPVGCPDIIFMLEGFYGGIETKKSPKAPFQPLQKETIKKLNDWSWCKAVDPSNWDIIKKELEGIL